MPVEIAHSWMRSMIPVVLLVLAALMLGAGCTSSPEPASYQRHGFSFEYPSSWNLSEDRDPDGGYTLTLDAGRGNSLTISTTPNLSTAYPPTSRLDTFEVWTAESRARLISVNATVIEERDETVAGNSAHRIVSAVRKDGTAYRSALVVTAIDDTGYSFNLFALPEEYERLERDLQSVLSSFRVDRDR